MKFIYLVINRNGIKIPFRKLSNANAFLNGKRGKYYVSHSIVNDKEYNSIVFLDGGNNEKI